MKHAEPEAEEIAVQAPERENVSPQAPEEEAAAEALPEKSELELLQEKYDELNDRYLRLMAEYDNYRKRSIRERDEIYGNATSAAAARFLPVLDNFERAACFDKSGDDFAKGFDMIYQGFQEVFAALGVAAFGEVGEPFDPQLHHAVLHIEDETLGENVVSQVLQKGYRLGDKVIRCAMVQTAN